jgi:hypothetical protein
MKSRVAQLYLLPNFYLVHTLDQAPPGFWVPVPPYEKLSADVEDGELGRAVRDAVDRSKAMDDYQPSRAAQDGDLIRAAGFRSRKQFVNSAATCTVSKDAPDRSVIRVRRATRDAKGAHWLPDAEESEIDQADLAGLGQLLRTVLAR